MHDKRNTYKIRPPDRFSGSTAIFCNMSAVDTRPYHITSSAFLVKLRTKCVKRSRKHGGTTNVLYESQIRTLRNCMYTIQPADCTTVYVHYLTRSYAVSYAVQLRVHRTRRRSYQSLTAFWNCDVYITVHSLTTSLLHILPIVQHHRCTPELQFV